MVLLGHWTAILSTIFCTAADIVVPCSGLPVIENLNRSTDNRDSVVSIASGALETSKTSADQQPTADLPSLSEAGPAEQLPAPLAGGSPPSHDRSESTAMSGAGSLEGVLEGNFAEDVLSDPLDPLDLGDFLL